MARPTPRKPALALGLQSAASGDGQPSKAQFKTWASAAIQPGCAAVELSIRLVDAEEGQTLNRDYRGKDYATNVLTFTYADEMPAIPGLPLLGDLVFCHPVVLREAAEQGKPATDHYAHLTVHGMLHLQGYDHEQDAEAEAMEALETRILAGLGIADPYAQEKDPTPGSA